MKWEKHLDELLRGFGNISHGFHPITKFNFFFLHEFQKELQPFVNIEKRNSAISIFPKTTISLRMLWCEVYSVLNCSSFPFWLLVRGTPNVPFQTRFNTMAVNSKRIHRCLTVTGQYSQFCFFLFQGKRSGKNVNQCHCFRIIEHKALVTSYLLFIHA